MTDDRRKELTKLMAQEEKSLAGFNKQVVNARAELEKAQADFTDLTNMITQAQQTVANANTTYQATLQLQAEMQGRINRIRAELDSSR